jgi:hypothetical protein
LSEVFPQGFPKSSELFFSSQRLKKSTKVVGFGVGLFFFYFLPQKSKKFASCNMFRLCTKKYYFYVQTSAFNLTDHRNSSKKYNYAKCGIILVLAEGEKVLFGVWYVTLEK